MNGPTKRRKRPIEPKPLKRFDYGLVRDQFAGLLINTDRDLERLVNTASSQGEEERDRQLSLLHLFARLAKNSYHAVLYVAETTREDSWRRPNYILVIPPINRQLLDLLFSLIYMLDDFPIRSLGYQKAGYREFHEELQQFKTEFGSDPDWKDHFDSIRSMLKSMGQRFGISADEIKNPDLIAYWKHPYELKDEQTESRSFLRYLNKWLYSDTSSQAHLSFSGLIRLVPMLISDLAGTEAQRFTEARTIKQFHFIHVSRSAIVTLAIVTEINRYCKLDNDAVINYLWCIFAEYNAEAKEMWTRRYAKRI